MGLRKPVKKQANILSAVKTIYRLAAGNGSPAAELPGDVEQILGALLEGEIELQGLMPWSSNYTFLASLTTPAGQTSFLSIYKPCQGERPLWDFPDGTLCQREFASFLVSQILGWPRIPPTVLREGPHGEGSVQLFIDAEYEAHYFNMRNMPTFTEEFKRIALFDFIVNNADRKGGHCLRGKDGKVWAIDHGLTFHTDFKLRTVIWEFCEEKIAEELLNDLKRLQQALENVEFCRLLMSYISAPEVKAFRNRINRLVVKGYFPELHHGRNIPFPPI